jgi:hypothetical protein
VIVQATSVSVSASVKAFGYGVLMIRPSTDLSKSSKLRVLLGRTVDLSIELDCLVKGKSVRCDAIGKVCMQVIVLGF